MNGPPVYPHGPVEQIADDVFMVRGSIRMNPVVRITRNMAIVRNGSELTLVNPIRLSPAGEAELSRHLPRRQRFLAGQAERAAERVACLGGDGQALRTCPPSARRCQPLPGPPLGRQDVLAHRLVEGVEGYLVHASPPLTGAG